jgi:transcription initiation factor IIE alpha subunit
MSKEVKVITNKIINEIVGVVVGEDSLAIVDFLKDKKNISEFIVAEKIKLDMQTTRNILYRLHTHNIATYIRRKD